MAASGEYIASDYELAFLEPGSTNNWYELTTYVNQDALSRSVGAAETTAHGVDARTKIPGLKDNEFSFTLMHNNTAALAQRPQTRLEQLLDDRTITTWRIRALGTGNGLPEKTFSGFVSQMDDDYANDDQPVASEVTITISGNVTNATQT